MIINPVNRKKLSAQIFVELQKFFSEANFQPGERLPSERDLAAALEVSRNSLREAFRVLEILGLIEVIPGSGTYIKKVNDDTILPLAMALSIENNSLEELMEVRLILESSGANLAAQRRNAQDLAQMEKALEEMQASIRNIKNWVKADIRFHYLIAKAASNSLLLRLYRTIADSLAESVDLAVHERIKSDQLALSTLDEHVQIYEEIKAQNGQSANEKMLRHLSGALEEIHKTIQD
ncbi:MAG: FadR/GntR family transcriptional regulator [Peptococcaceae bacterium]